VASDSKLVSDSLKRFKDSFDDEAEPFRVYMYADPSASTKELDLFGRKARDHSLCSIVLADFQG
jgi:hypothetical protein